MANIKENDKVLILNGINKGIFGTVKNHRVNGIEIFNVICIYNNAILAFNEKTVLFSDTDVRVVSSESDTNNITDIKDSIVVNIEHCGNGLIYELQFLENDTYQDFYLDYAALCNHYPEYFDLSLIANESFDDLSHKIQTDIENEEMEFYLFDGTDIIHIDESNKFNKSSYNNPKYM